MWGEKVHLTSERIGIEAAIQDILNIIKYNDLNDIVLVGHSFAGKIVAAVADRVPERVGIVIYLDAFRPRKIRTPQGSFPDEWPIDCWQVPFPEVILDSVGKDFQAADREWMMSKATHLPVKYFRDPVTLSDNFDSVKSAFIFCTGGGRRRKRNIGGKVGRPCQSHRVGSLANDYEVERAHRGHALLIWLCRVLTPQVPDVKML